MGQKVRLQVALARSGFASRRSAVEIIKSGRVKVDGKIILKPGQRVEIGKDNITLDNKSTCIQKKVYFLLNKPKDVVATVRDKYASRKVIDLIGCNSLRIYPIGRLDKDTTGLIILTNDGEVAYRLSHPKFGIKKVYRVCVRGSISPKALKKLENGVVLEGKKTFPCKIDLIADEKSFSGLEIRLTEGRKRQIKKMFAMIRHPVLSIERVAFGPLKLGQLKTGNWRRLTAKELRALRKAAGVI
ncbi:MAG: rRNA pseudouridine synthase [Candidatus Omnitrophica bacterium]|nr:rRNA pseudouridine synthase [Candidatus Omnitrophota bacterium]